MKINFSVVLQHVQADPPNNKNLAQLVVMLLQFMEDNFGPKAPRPPMTKLPVSNATHALLISGVTWASPSFPPFF